MLSSNYPKTFIRNYPPNTLNYAKSSEADHLIGFQFGSRLCDALVLQFWVMAKVHKKAKLKTASFQIIENLSAMLVSELDDCLWFDDYFLVADEVGEIFLGENSAPILQRQPRLGDCWNAAMLEFNTKTLLINRLVKGATLVLVDFEAGSNNGITFILEDKVWC
jgi:hypothetical protein